MNLSKISLYATVAPKSPEPTMRMSNFNITTP